MNLHKQREYSAAHPDKKIIRLSIGDVTQPLAPAIIERLHSAVDEMAVAETFKGYAPDLGYEFLRNTIVKNDYIDHGVDISADEIFVSDGAALYSLCFFATVENKNFPEASDNSHLP